MTPDELSQGLNAFGGVGGGNAGADGRADYVDGCVELRGRIGDWEQDFIYEDLATDKNGLLRGSSIEDVMTDIEEGQRTGGSMNGRTRSFSDSNPECGSKSVHKRYAPAAAPVAPPVGDFGQGVHTGPGVGFTGG